MFFELKEMDRIKKLLQNDDYAKRGYESLKKEVDELTSNGILEIEKRAVELCQRASTLGVGKVMRYGNYLRDTSALMCKIAFIQQIEQIDKKDEWLRLAKVVCNDKWQIQGKFDGWESDLWTADIGTNLAISYQVMQSRLESDEQKFIEENLWEKGFLPIYDEWVSPEKHVHALDTMGHNWWSVCVAGAGVILLTLNKQKDFDKYLENIVDGYNQWFAYKGNLLLNKKPNFGEQNDYIETLSYLMYGMSNFVIFNEMLEKQQSKYRFDLDNIFSSIPDYFIHNHYYTEDGLQFNQFGDNKVISAKKQLLFKVCSEYKRGDFLPIVKDIGDIKNPIDLYFYPEELEESKIAIPNEAIYENAGCAVIRDGFGKNDMAFFMKGGETWNHNHLDIGSFELFYNGEKFITDSGSCSYSNHLYKEYYITTKAHNTLTFNGKGQLPSTAYTGTKFIGTFPCLFKGKDYRYLLADCTGPYTNVFQRFYRHVMFLQDIIVIIDDVQTYEDGSIETHLHGKGEMKAHNDSIEILNNSGSMSVYYPFSDLSDVELEDGYLAAVPTYDEREEITPEAQYIIHKYQTNECRQKLITLLVPNCESNHGIEIVENSSEFIKEIIIKRDNVTERIIINERADGRVMHQNGSINYLDIETDAAIVYIREKDDNLSITMHNGSYIKQNGIVLLSSLVKCNIMLDDKKCYVTAPNDMIVHVQKDNRLEKYSLTKGEHIITL